MFGENQKQLIPAMLVEGYTGSGYLVVTEFTMNSSVSILESNVRPSVQLLKLVRAYNRTMGPSAAANLQQKS